MANPAAETHCPSQELVTRSKLSCLSWNKYLKTYLASSDYEGVVHVWDIATGQNVAEYEAHEKRIWSVDFCHTDPMLLMSGSDDGMVKVLLQPLLLLQMHGARHKPAQFVLNLLWELHSWTFDFCLADMQSVWPNSAPLDTSATLLPRNYARKMQQFSLQSAVHWTLLPCNCARRKQQLSLFLTYTDALMRTGLTGCCLSVQIWSTNQANSVAEIDIKANVCCAKYNPESMYEIAVGAADHTVLTYDLRKSDKAVHTYKGTSPA